MPVHANPFFAKPGEHSGRACIIIYDENGEPTGKHCFSEGKAQEIIARLEQREGRSAKPSAMPPRQPREERPQGERRSRQPPEDADALRKKYRRLRIEALHEFRDKTTKMADRLPITEEDEQEFDKTVKGFLVKNNMELSAENYVDIAGRMYHHARFMPSSRK